MREQDGVAIGKARCRLRNQPIVLDEHHIL
jgi:hypothetical protein